MAKVIGIVLTLGCVVLCGYQIYGIISDGIKRRKLKKEHPEAEEKKKDDEEERQTEIPRKNRVRRIYGKPSEF